MCIVQESYPKRPNTVFLQINALGTEPDKEPSNISNFNETHNLNSYVPNHQVLNQSVDFSGYVTTPPAVYSIIAAWNLSHQIS